MHIALCDDNVADRKQFERLVKRESDRRAADEGILFADSFGNSESLLTNPMQYDVFYIDMCKTPGVSGAVTSPGVSGVVTSPWVSVPSTASAGASVTETSVFPGSEASS